MEIPRKLDLIDTSRSILLLGPRQTGKTWLLKHSFPTAPYFNLLHSETFLRLSTRPGSLREELLALRSSEPIIIDEIQKLPLLLDEIQAMIDELGVRFILTGSSARKLKRSGVNLLGGRARIRKLHPLVSAEIGEIDLARILAWGSLPPIHLSDDPWDDLRSYCGTYLQQEIADEGISRRIDAFARFLRVAAIMNGELLNFEALASDAAVPARTIREYYAVLADTLLGELVEPWGRGARRKAISTGRFWFFDLGVRNALAGDRGFSEGSERWGKNLEHFIYAELRAFLDYRLDDRPLCFWRTRDGREVDFVVGNETAIEVKASAAIADRHLAGLEAIAEEGNFRRRILICSAPRASLMRGIDVLPVKSFLEELWAGRL
jgi:predicted AAA+ superfamily ATPase